MLRCSATTAVASPHMPVSLACFGSGLFNELEKTLDKLEAEGGEREREGGEREGRGLAGEGGNWREDGKSG